MPRASTSFCKRSKVSLAKNKVPVNVPSGLGKAIAISPPRGQHAARPDRAHAVPEEVEAQVPCMRAPVVPSHSGNISGLQEIDEPHFPHHRADDQVGFQALVVEMSRLFRRRVTRSLFVRSGTRHSKSVRRRPRVWRSAVPRPTERMACCSSLATAGGSSSLADRASTGRPWACHQRPRFRDQRASAVRPSCRESKVDGSSALGSVLPWIASCFQDQCLDVPLAQERGQRLPANPAPTTMTCGCVMRCFQIHGPSSGPAPVGRRLRTSCTKVLEPRE